MKNLIRITILQCPGTIFSLGIARQGDVTLPDNVFFLRRQIGHVLMYGERERIEVAVVVLKAAKHFWPEHNIAHAQKKGFNSFSGKA